MLGRTKLVNALQYCVHGFHHYLHEAPDNSTEWPSVCLKLASKHHIKQLLILDYFTSGLQGGAFTPRKILADCLSYWRWVQPLLLVPDESQLLLEHYSKLVLYIPSALDETPQRLKISLLSSIDGPHYLLLPVLKRLLMNLKKTFQRQTRRASTEFKYKGMKNIQVFDKGTNGCCKAQNINQRWGRLEKLIKLMFLRFCAPFRIRWDFGRFESFHFHESWSATCLNFFRWIFLYIAYLNHIRMRLYLTISFD